MRQELEDVKIHRPVMVEGGFGCEGLDTFSHFHVFDCIQNLMQCMVQYR